jgi:hypothetical protein
MARGGAPDEAAIIVACAAVLLAAIGALAVTLAAPAPVASISRRADSPLERPAFGGAQPKENPCAKLPCSSPPSR